MVFHYNKTMQDIAKIQSKLFPYSIGVYFDAESETKIRTLWEVLAERGVANYFYHSESRPHLTLATYNDLDLEKIDEILTSIGEKNAPIPISFQYIGVFPTTRGIFLGPVVTKPLLKLHRQIYQEITPYSILSGIPYYLPEKWVPHCGVAVEVEPEHIPSVVQITDEMITFPFDATITEIGITTNRSENQYCCYQLVG